MLADRSRSLTAVTALVIAGSATPAIAAGPVRSTVVSVSIRNATRAPVTSWSLKLKLGARTRLVRATGGRASRRTGSLVVTANAPRTLAAGARRTFTLRISGSRRPAGFALSATPAGTCKATSGQRHGSQARLSVACTISPLPTAAAGTGSTPSPAPATGAPAPAPGTAGGSRWYPFAPYVDMAAYPAPDLGAIRTQGGVNHISLGFVTAQGGKDCVPTWGGYKEYPASGGAPYLGSEVKALQAAGGDGVVSFGGAAGTELAAACSSASTLAAAYQSVVDAYGATHVDFDVEGGTLGDGAANQRRATAVAQLQAAAKAAGRTLLVAYTLPVEPDGLTAAGQAVVKVAADTGVDVALVNGMAMDYADDQAEMGDRALGVAAALQRQLPSLIAGLDAAGALARTGITPMLGINDQPREIFTLDDAARLASWAAANHPGMLGMWQLARDHQCPGATTTTSETCSGVTQGDYAFSKALGRSTR